MAAIKVENLKKSFGKMEVLRGISFELQAGKQYVIQGASGSGKSTLLYLLGGLDRPGQGSIWVEGKNLTSIGDEELADYRNRTVGFVFQFHFLLPSMTCLDNILLPAHIGGVDVRAIKDEAMALASELGVRGCLDKFPFELSGGEQQRINLIRALSLRPKVLLCDEPTGNLDSENTQLVTRLLRQLAQSFQSTLIVVTHDNKVASAFENQFIMRDGMLIT